MYNLTDDQIDYIAADLSARGLEMESLRDDLLDHVCCIIERELEANGDFRLCYDRVIRTFYKKDLREIETETLLLLQHKNYYAMKKVMIASGILSAALMSIGIFFKFMHYPGAGMGIVTGIVLFSFIFLPLMFALRLKEKQVAKDKWLLGLGILATALISMGTLFKIMHWPGANILGLSAVGTLLLLYLPINLITGIRNPATKVNTIVTTILVVAGCGLFLSLARSPQGSVKQYIVNTNHYLRSEHLYRSEMQHRALLNDAVAGSEVIRTGRTVLDLSEGLKRYLLSKETGTPELDENFVKSETWVGETYAEMYIKESAEGSKLYNQLLEQLKSYTNECGKIGVLSATGKFDWNVDSNNERVNDVLDRIVQLQLLILQNERFIAEKQS
jgi:hypothetical protein